ncbi:MAG TPA: DUF2207 domain-containing protein [Euzebyales bacterium]
MLLVAAVCLLAGVVLGAAPAADAQSRSQTYDEVDIDAQLRSDGSLRVVERRTIDYRGSWNGELYQLPLRDGQQVTLNAIRDDRGTTYRAGSCSPDGAREPGAYELLGDEDQFEVAWCWQPPPVDEVRTVTLDYTVTNAGERHADSSELFWKWVGEGWDAPTARLVADVELPTSQDLQFWAHGPLTGTVEETEPGVVRTAVEQLPANTFVELRVLMPQDALADAPNDGRAVREEILAEEGCLARQANAERARARGEEPTDDCDPDAGLKLALTGAVGLLLVGGGAGWWQLFRTHGREYALPPELADLEYEHDLPSDHTPAHVDYLLRWGSVGETALTATVLDLARRGHVRLRREMVTTSRTLRPDVEESVTYFERRSEPERSWEQEVMELLFDRAARGGRTVSDTQLKSWVNDHRQDAYSWWQRWTSMVAADTAGQRWIESHGWVGASIALGLAMIAAGIAAALYGANLVVVGLTVASGIGAVAASPLMRRRTPEGRVLEHRWRRFGAYLTDYSLIPERGPEYLALWGHWLVYAVPLGVAETVARNLETKLSEAELEQVGGGWYPMMYYHGHLYGGFDSGLSSVAAAIPTSAIASSPQSSSAGGGGGFSGGGGGGGGGSGGGGF